MTRLKENIAYNVAGQSLVLLLSLVAVRFIYVRLGGDVFGLILFVLTLTPLLVTVLDLGLLTTLVREISQSSLQGHDYVRSLVRTASSVYWGMFGVTATLLFVAAPFLVSGWLHFSGLDVETASTLLRVLGICALSALPRAFYACVFRGLQNVKHNNFIDVSMATLQQAGTAVLIMTDHGSHAVVWWLGACFLLGTAAYVIMLGRVLGWTVLIPGWSRIAVERTVGSSMRVFAVSVLNMTSLQIDKLLASKILPIAMFGFYSFTANIVFRATFVSVAISMATLPALSILAATGKSEETLRHYRKLQDLQCVVAVPALALAIYAGIPVLGLLFGYQVAQKLLAPLAILCLGFFLQVSMATLWQLTLAHGRPDIISKSCLLGLIIASPIGLLATIALGVTGVALFWLSYNVILYTHMVPRIVSAILVGASLRTWYFHVGRLLIIGLATYGLPLIVALVAAPTTLILAGAYVLATMTFVAVSYGLLSEDLKLSFIGISKRLRPKLRHA